jgi:hypothetical protein
MLRQKAFRFLVTFTDDFEHFSINYLRCFFAELACAGITWNGQVRVLPRSQLD